MNQPALHGLIYKLSVRNMLGEILLSFEVAIVTYLWVVQLRVWLEQYMPSWLSITVLTFLVYFIFQFGRSWQYRRITRQEKAVEKVEVSYSHKFAAAVVTGVVAGLATVAYALLDGGVLFSSYEWVLPTLVVGLAGFVLMYLLA